MNLAEQLIGEMLEAKEPDKMKLAKWADAIEKKAAKRVKMLAKATDSEEKSVLKGDIKDLRKLAAAVKAGDHKSATRVLDKMQKRSDRGRRDRGGLAPGADVPPKVYDWLIPEG